MPTTVLNGAVNQTVPRNSGVAKKSDLTICFYYRNWRRGRDSNLPSFYIFQKLTKTYGPYLDQDTWLFATATAVKTAPELMSMPFPLAAAAERNRTRHLYLVDAFAFSTGRSLGIPGAERKRCEGKAWIDLKTTVPDTLQPVGSHPADGSSVTESDGPLRGG